MPPPENNCVVLVRPRLHLTLIGMNDEGYRCNGGVGISISDPYVRVLVSSNSEFCVEDTRRWPLQPDEIEKLSSVARGAATHPVRISICGEMPSHYGFGSATAIRLAAIEAIRHLQSKSPNREELVDESGRGGTSGIGVTTYFDGGIVFDVGAKSKRLGFAPSSSIESTRQLPLVLARFPMPEWKVGICIPGTLVSLSAAEENAFFKRVCPIPEPSVHEVLYHVVYGIVASAREHDFQTFCKAVRAIQGCIWKRMERELYGQELINLERLIYDAGASAVGLSSLGPGLFFFADSLEPILANLKSRHPQHSWQISTCWNSGRVIGSE